jgi:UDP-N-acetylenolpyruvoylglucosamine reductase
VAREVCGGVENSVSYGWSREHDFSANILAMKPDHSDFEVYHKDQLLGVATLGIPGKHNVSNALAAIALATKLGVAFESIQHALKTFRGARRRFEIRHSGERFTVVDDYGHHPSEIAATLATAKGLQPKRIVCVFQPHRYSRTQLLKKEFGASFDDVDELFVTDVYAASEKPLPGVSGNTIVEEVREHDKARGVVRPAASFQFTPTMLMSRDKVGNALRPGDLLITLGAGNVHEVGRCIAKDLPVLEKLWEILEANGGGTAKLYEPMNRHTTFLIGGPAQYWVEPHTVAGFAEIVKHLRSASVPIRVIGRGSNLLVKDGGIRGAVIHPSKGEFEEVRVENGQLVCGVGARLKKIASAARNAGIGGLEWMEGVPGNLGGAIRMNAGAMGVEMADNLVSVRFIAADGSVQEKPLSEIQHQYRSIAEFEERYILVAVLKGKPATMAEIDAGLEASRMKRRTSQPIGASAGCMFKNPQLCGAGKLVDDLGLKGRRSGKVVVSEVHGNFFVNEGGATAREVLDLVAEIKEVAQRERGVQLEMEVKVIGEDQPLPL